MNIFKIDDNNFKGRNNENRTCLIIIGVTGIVVDKIYLKQIEKGNKLLKLKFNKGSIVLGSIFKLFSL